MFSTIQANRQLQNTITRGIQMPARPATTQNGSQVARSFFTVLLKALSTFSA